MRKIKRYKKGQVWVETVTYTLVAFVMIGLVLAFAQPKIKELQDKSIIEQSLDMMKDIDLKISELGETGVGNVRKIEINLRKGELNFDSINDSISFFMEGEYLYSELGEKYSDGNFDILTEENGKYYNVLIERKYDNFNITYSGDDEDKKLTASSKSYVLLISNEGGLTPKINFELG